MRFFAVAAIVLVVAYCAWLALGPETQLDIQLHSPVYAVSDPIASTVAVPQEDDTPPPSSITPALQLRVDDPVTVDASIDRGTAVQVTPTVAAAAPVGLHGLPLAPAGLTACETASFYRAQAGLPVVFDALAYRESRCQPDASNWCCSGVYQIHKLWIPNLAGCDVYVRDDLYDGQRNACAAAFVFAAQGITAWSTA